MHAVHFVCRYLLTGPFFVMRQVSPVLQLVSCQIYHVKMFYASEYMKDHIFELRQKDKDVIDHRCYTQFKRL